MKEVTYEDWQKNPTPRMMWVWDDKVGDKVKRKVIYFNENKHAHYPIIALTEDSTVSVGYKHCAEIEEPKTRRMTYKELSRWLRKKPNREYMYITSDFICCSYDYREKNQDKEVHEDIRIRENDGEWREPLVEVEEWQVYLQDTRTSSFPTQGKR